MKTLKKYLLIVMASLMLPFSFQSCDEEGNVDWTAVEALIEWLLGRTGWLADDEDPSDVPDDPEPPRDDEDGLAKSVDLSNYFPPIGDQGQFGTCVAWATGYNLKTAVDAQKNGWTLSESNYKQYATSPKDLWFAIPENDKGTKCNGTNFEPSLTALQTTGAASIKDVPYENMGTCTGTAKGSSNKIVRFRKIAYKDISGMTVNNFKAYLNEGIPVAIGAQLGEYFMNWKGSGVISEDTEDYQGQHAYHAMALVGYDDSKGNNGAFRVRNSWGTSWGDGGSIWVDYNFFINQFCFAGYIAENTTAASVPQRAKNTTSVSASDFNLQENTVKVQANNAQKVVFIYYNASNARDYGILAETSKNNATLSFALPSLTGKYYFAAIVNPDGKNDNDDFYFFTTAGAQPLVFVNGAVQNAPVQGTANITDKAPNAYTPQEIKRVLARK